MEFYWSLKYGNYDDLHTIYISPDKVELVKKRWDNGQPIHTSTGSIPANQIREFEISDRPFGDQKLLADASQAFKEPIIVDQGIGKFADRDKDGTLIMQGEVHYYGVQSSWVKKIVTRNKWEKYYSIGGFYYLLSEDGGTVTIGFTVPTHLVNQLATPYCSPDEIKALLKMSGG